MSTPSLLLEPRLTTRLDAQLITVRQRDSDNVARLLHLSVRSLLPSTASCHLPPRNLQVFFLHFLTVQC
jgi:hypothetical protein